MAVDAAHPHVVALAALVAADDLHGGGLSDDDGERGRQVLGQVRDEAFDAGAADFLVVGKGEVDGRGEVGRGHAFGVGNAAGDEALHVRRAAGVQLAVAFGEGERVRVPVLVVHGHDVGVAGQNDAAGAIGTDGGPEVRLGALLVEGEAGSEAERFEMAAQVFDQIEVGQAGTSCRRRRGERASRWRLARRGSARRGKLS